MAKEKEKEKPTKKEDLRTGLRKLRDSIVNFLDTIELEDEDEKSKEKQDG